MFPPPDPREIDYLPDRAKCANTVDNIKKLQENKNYKISQGVLDDAIKLTREFYEIQEKPLNSRKLKLQDWVFGNCIGDQFMMFGNFIGDPQFSEKVRIKNVLRCLEKLKEDETPFKGLIDYTKKFFDEMIDRPLLPKRAYSFMPYLRDISA